jgi:hypothetical protein
LSLAEQTQHDEDRIDFDGLWDQNPPITRLQKLHISLRARMPWLMPFDDDPKVNEGPIITAEEPPSNESTLPLDSWFTQLESILSNLSEKQS